MAVLDWPLLTGVIPLLIGAAGLGALAVLLAARRDRRWWLRRVPLVLLAAVAGVATAAAAAAAAHPFPDPLPGVVWWSSGAALTGVGLAGTVCRRAEPRRRVLACVASLVVLVAAGNQVNQYFGEFPTVRAALGLRLTDQVDIGEVSPAGPGLVARSPGRPLSQVWSPPAGMPPHGAVSQVTIPSTVSHFDARPGWVYLPPAYLGLRRARLPVLVLLGGQPGSPRDWLDGGRLAAMMDRFAAAHAGLAPIVVMPDLLGAVLANPLCLDSHLGRAQTYLVRDVPAWIRATLQVDPDPAVWAVGGFSAGGTCALQLAVNAPQVYPTFLDISGQAEPTLGDRTQTVRAAFGGDNAAFAEVNPLDELSRRRYPGTAGVIVVGRDDAVYRPQAQRVTRATLGAGMAIEYREVAGAHNWHVWAPGLETSLSWLGSRLQLIAS
jgi:S-formylglutathione hydrolase FrmB